MKEKDIKTIEPTKSIEPRQLGVFRCQWCGEVFKKNLKGLNAINEMKDFMNTRFSILHKCYINDVRINDIPAGIADLIGFDYE